MILDALGLLSDAQAITVDAVSTNTVDLSNVTPKRRIGDGEPLGIAMIVDVAADHTTGDETYIFNILEDDDPALGSPTIIASYTLLYSQLTAGARHFFPMPPGRPTLRYIGLGFDVGGTTPTITVTAWLTLQSMVDKPFTYAKGYTIS